jgi:hypothetical protein
MSIEKAVHVYMPSISMLMCKLLFLNFKIVCVCGTSYPPPAFKEKRTKNEEGS